MIIHDELDDNTIEGVIQEIKDDIEEWRKYQKLYWIIDKIKKGKVKLSAAAPQPVAAQPPVFGYDDPEAYKFFGAIQENVNVTDFTGDKFYSGFGPTNWYLTDYWTLRARSRQLFQDNLYARGIIRRYVTNIINTGLTLESNPEEALLGFEPDALVDWSEKQENLFQKNA